MASNVKLMDQLKAPECGLFCEEPDAPVSKLALTGITPAGLEALREVEGR